MGVWLLLPTWLSISYLHSLPDNNGANCVMGLLLITWIADTGAYFAGRFTGKHLLLPKVSPKKTWEGFWGGCVSTGIFAFVCSYFYDLNIWWYLLVAVTLIYAVLGDLFESMIKRKAGVKDSGQLLPGHGGLLDRIDSLLAAAPVFALGWMIWQI
jgi:phosphatidate cytidylyltransferase